MKKQRHQLKTVEEFSTVIEISAKEHHESGNSYFSAQVHYKNSLILIPFQYGYGEQYKHISKLVLFELGLIESSHWYDIDKAGIKVIDYIKTDCTQQQVEAWGELERSQKDINLVYKHTHRDYKGINHGKKCAMWYDNGTVSGPIEIMPEDIFHINLRSAKAKEAKK